MSASDPTLVLASASPRRRALLERAGVAFAVRPADVDETARPGEDPAALAERLARAKALAVARALGPEPARWVLGADTLVVRGAEVLGKPADDAEAMSHLTRLLGHTHRVITAVAVMRSDTLAGESLHVESAVRMRAASAREIREYVASGEPRDKAGGYAVQGGGRRFIEHIEGSESNVIGLPLDETLALLRAQGALG